MRDQWISRMLGNDRPEELLTTHQIS